MGVLEVVHHGDNKDSMVIWFKRIDERAEEFIKMFERDYCLLLKPRALHGVAKGNISTVVLPLFHPYG